MSNRLHTLKVYEDNVGQELLVTRHDQFNVPINVINIYGQVESRCTVDSIDDRWRVVIDQVKKIEAKGELLVLIGDLNAHIGDVVSGNKDKISHRGKIVRQ